MPYRTIDIPVGTTFERLTTVSKCRLKPRSDGRNHSVVDVRCSCGKSKTVKAYSLMSGRTRSCGCIQREDVTKRMTTHGLTAGGAKRPKLLNVWKNVRERCLNPNARNYRWYGAKGISICDDWDDFLSFQEWAISSGYKEGLELDRIDSDRNYEPSNCRWVTKKQNIRNRDLFWSDELDARLVAHAKEVGVSPYEVIREALEDYLPSR